MTADINRWHCHPQRVLRLSGDTVSRHQRQVTRLAHEVSAAIALPVHDGRLIEYCERHDEPEHLFGDWPATICRDPRVKALKAQLEAEYWASIGYAPPVLSDIERLVFELCDKLESLLWARSVGADLQIDGFPVDVIRLWKLAHSIGPDAADWLRMRIDQSAPVV
jgi:hypothetical protein